MEGPNVIRIGNKKIMWGRATISNAPSDQDRTVNVTFPEEFDSVPRVAVACAGWIAIRAVFSVDTSKTSTKLGAMHAQGRSLDVDLEWVAIG